MSNQKVLDVLNSLEVFETNGGEDAYVLVKNNEENRKALNAVGVSTETINKYGDEETFCILSLAFSEGYATSYENNYGIGKLVYEVNSSKRVEVNEVYCNLCDKKFYEFEDAELDKCPHCKESLRGESASIEKTKEVEIEVNFKTGQVQVTA